MLLSFEINELYLYFAFMKSSEGNDYYNEIYEKYKKNIIKNNKNVSKYIFDIAKTSHSNITFDSGFDLFNIDEENIYGKHTTLVDFKINSCMKIKKYIINVQNNYSIYLDYIFNEILGLDNYISYLCNGHKLDITKNFEAYGGYYLYPRSSLGFKTPLRCANSVGIIDSGYRGSIKGCLTNINELEYKLVSSERYMQLCPGNISYPTFITEVSSLDELGSTTRGTGGFGSSGK